MQTPSDEFWATRGSRRRVLKTSVFLLILTSFDGCRRAYNKSKLCSLLTHSYQTVGAFDTCLIEWKPVSKKMLSPWGQFKQELSLFLWVAICLLPAGFLISFGFTSSLCRKSECRNPQCATVLSHSASHRKWSFSKCICDDVVGCGIVQASLSLLLFSCLLITVRH